MGVAFHPEGLASLAGPELPPRKGCDAVLHVIKVPVEHQIHIWEAQKVGEGMTRLRKKGGKREKLNLV